MPKWRKRHSFLWTRCKENQIFGDIFVSIVTVECRSVWRKTWSSVRLVCSSIALTAYKALYLKMYYRTLASLPVKTNYCYKHCYLLCCCYAVVVRKESELIIVHTVAGMPDNDFLQERMARNPTFAAHANFLHRFQLLDVSHTCEAYLRWNLTSEV